MNLALSLKIYYELNLIFMIIPLDIDFFLLYRNEYRFEEEKKKTNIRSKQQY